jgi:hypothetical protein
VNGVSRQEESHSGALPLSTLSNRRIGPLSSTGTDRESVKPSAMSKLQVRNAVKLVLALIAALLINLPLYVFRAGLPQEICSVSVTD